MLKMRLQRYGRKNDPSFRVVVLEGAEGPKSGNHVDQIGSYNAVTKHKTLDKEKAKHWLSKGVQPSDTVYNFLVSEGVIEGKKKNVLPSKRPIVKTEEPNPPAGGEAPVSAEATPDEPVATPEADVSSEASAKEEETPAAEPVAVEETPTEAPAEEPTV